VTAPEGGNDVKGHIRPDDRGRKNVWRIILELDRDASGRRKQKWHTVYGTKRDAERELSRLTNEVHTGQYVLDAEKLTVREYLDRWLTDYAKANVGPKVFQEYEGKIRTQIMPALGRHQLTKLTPLHVQRFYTHLCENGRLDGKGGLAGLTVVHIHRILNRSLKQAVRWQLIPRNPAEAVEPPRPGDREGRALDVQQSRRLLELAADSWLYVPILLALGCGLRRGEVLGLRWRDVDLDAGQLTVAQATEQTKAGVTFKSPKSKSSRRTLALPAPVVVALRRHKKEQEVRRSLLGAAYQDLDLVVASDDGSVVVPERLTGRFRDFFEKHPELPRISFHDLRRTSCTLLALAGVNPKVASGILGHSDIRLTLAVYTEVLPEMSREAASKMGDVLSL
jgi:integrase